MGATDIHLMASKKIFSSAKDAYRELVDEALYEYGHDSYNGTISTCELVGKIRKPENDEEYEKALDRVDKREAVWYEDETHYHFIGWASC